MRFKKGDRVGYRTVIGTVNPATIVDTDEELNRVDILFDDEDPLEQQVYGGDWYYEEELEFLPEGN